MVLVVVSDVIRVRRVCEQPVALLESDSNDQRARFGRRMRRQTSHERPAQLQRWRAVVARCGFDAGQRETECLDDFEVDHAAIHILMRPSDPRVSLVGREHSWR